MEHQVRRFVFEGTRRGAHVAWPTRTHQQWQHSTPETANEADEAVPLPPFDAAPDLAIAQGSSLGYAGDLARGPMGAGSEWAAKAHVHAMQIAQQCVHRVR